MNFCTLFTLSILFVVSNAFTVYYSPRSSIVRDTAKRSSVGLSTTEMNDGNSLKGLVDEKSEVSKMEAWTTYLQTAEIQEIRQELIDKYLSLGRSQEYAETEIDHFLNDPSRSQKFLEMRRYVKSQQDASMGYENFLMYTGAFFFGLLGDAIFKHLAAIQESTNIQL